MHERSVNEGNSRDLIFARFNRARVVNPSTIFRQFRILFRANLTASNVDYDRRCRIDLSSLIAPFMNSHRDSHICKLFLTKANGNASRMFLDLCSFRASLAKYRHGSSKVDREIR
jgi:hypothetical protein